MNEIIFESESPDARKLAIFEDNGTSAVVSGLFCQP